MIITSAKVITRILLRRNNENYTRSEVQRSVSKQKFEYASYTDKLVKRY